MEGREGKERRGHEGREIKGRKGDCMEEVKDEESVAEWLRHWTRYW